jgi:hypothetical protein
LVPSTQARACPSARPGSRVVPRTRISGVQLTQQFDESGANGSVTSCCSRRACTSFVRVAPKHIGLSEIVVSLLQSGTIAGDASNVLPGSGAQFHRDEATRQAIYAETLLCLSVLFGNSARSGPPAMGAAKRNGPSGQRDHGLSVIAVHDRFVRRLRAGILCRCRSQSLFKIAHVRREGTVVLAPRRGTAATAPKGAAEGNGRSDCDPGASRCAPKAKPPIGNARIGFLNGGTLPRRPRC